MENDEDAVTGAVEFTVPKAYPSRDGTSDSGKEYEVKVAALLMIRTMCQSETKQAWLAINVDHCGAFDDVVLCRQREDGDVTVYLIQLKHGDKGGHIEAKKFTTKKTSAFFLPKYFNSISEIQAKTMENKNSAHLSTEKSKGVIEFMWQNDDNTVFILFTNREPFSDCNFLKPVTKNSCINAKWKLSETIDTSSGATIFEFDYEKLEKYEIHGGIPERFFLFARQQHLSQMNDSLCSAVKKFIWPIQISEKRLFEVTSKLLHYLNDWSKGKFGGHYPLTKSHIIKKLTELLLEPYMVQLGEPKGRKKFHQDIWSRLADGQDIIYITQSDTMVMQFVKDYIHGVLEAYCTNSVNKSWWKANADTVKEMSSILNITNNISYIEAYPYLWKTKQIPLLLEVGGWQATKEIHSILNRYDGILRAIVLNKSERVVEHLVSSKVFNNLTDLDAHHQDVILRRPVMFQGKKISIELIDLIGAEHLSYVTIKDIIYMLCGSFNIGGQFDSIPEFVEQTSVSKVWLDASVLLKVQNEMFVILCNSLDKLKRFLQKQIVRITEPLMSSWKYIDKNPHATIIISDNEEELEAIKKYCLGRSEVFHILGFDGHSSFEWLKSSSSIENIKSFRKANMNLKTNTSGDLLNAIIKNRKSILVSSEAGMGKSVLLNDMAHNAPSDLWILKINLVEYKEIYKLWETESASTSLLSNFVHTVLNQNKCDNNLNRAIFAKYFDNRNVIFLMDGFDEIPVKYQIGAKMLLKFVQDSGLPLCLTSRPGLKTELETVLNTFSLKLNLLTRSSQEKFLQKYFGKATNNVLADKPIKSFVNELLDTTIQNLNDKDNFFVGVPLQLGLLAQTYLSDCRKYLETGSFEKEHFELLYLYKHIMQEKIEIARNKIESISEDVLYQYKICHSFYALQLIFPESNLKLLRIDEKIKEAVELFPLLIQLIQKDGIVVAENAQKVTFVNKRLAEFLAAEWMSENIEGEYKEIATNLVKEALHPNFDSVHNLFDRILAKNCPLHLAVLNRQVEEFRRLIGTTTDNANVTDAANRNVMHLIASWGLHCPLDTSMIDDFFNFKRQMTDDEMVKFLRCVPQTLLEENNKDIILGYTALDYAIARCSFNLANNICAKLVNMYYFSSINVLNNGPALKYMRDMHFQSLLITVYKFRYNFPSNFQKSINIQKPDSLHSIVRGGDVQKVGSIISNQLSINETETDTGYSPLHIAVIYGFAEIVSLLLSNNANPHQKDNSGRTPLHWALSKRTRYVDLEKKNASNDLTLYHSSKDDVTITDLIVATSKPINVKDNDGNTALHLAANNGHEHFIHLLLTQGAVKDERNNDGNVALSLATYNGYSNVVSLLLAEGVDKEIKNNEGNSALNISASLGHTHIARLLLLKGADRETKSDDGNTPLITAAIHGNVQVLNLFILQACDKEAKNKDGDTALTISALHGHTNIVNILLTEGCSKDAKNNSGDTAFIIAAGNGYVDVINVLLTHGVYKNAKNLVGVTALLNAVCSNHEETVNVLLANHCDTEAKVYTGSTALALMAASGKIEFVKLLLSKGANKDVRNDEGNLPIHVAAFRGHFAVVDLMLCQGSSIDSKGIDQNTPLILAAVRGHSDVVNMLLKRGCDKDARNDNGETALIVATGKVHIEVVNLLLCAGCDTNIKTNNGVTALMVAAHEGYKALANLLLAYNSDKEATCNFGNTALITAASKGNTDIIRLLLKEGCNNDAKNCYDETALITAANFGYAEVVDILLSYNCDVNAKTTDGNSSLYYAALNGHSTVVNLLLSHGCDVNGKNTAGDTALIAAASSGHHEIVHLLLSYDSDVETQNDEGNNALITAANTGNAYTVYLLLSEDANTDRSNNLGDTALILATKGNHINVVSLLLSYGVDKEIKTEKGNTALLLAASEGYTGIVNLLLCEGANAEVSNGEGDTALMIACYSNHPDVVTTLLSSGCDIDTKNFSNNTALIFAAANGYADVVKLLLAEDSDVNSQNNDGNSALMVAARRGYSDIVKLLLEYDDNLERKNNDGDTALILASRNGHCNVVLLLFKEDVDIAAKNYDGHTALTSAASNGHLSVVDVLLSRGCDKDTKTKSSNTALSLAASGGHIATVITLLRWFTDTEVQDTNGDTALILAASNGHVDVVNKLVDYGSNKEARNNCGNTALACAVNNGRTEIVRLLLSRGCNALVKNIANESTLHLAVFKDHLEIINLLLQNDHEKEAKDDYGNTPLTSAAVHGHTNVVRNLIAKGWSKEDEDSDGNTIFILAAIYGHTSLLNFLLTIGVNKEARNNAGNTGLIIATSIGHQDIVDLLLVNNCNKEVKDSDGNTALILSAIYGHKDVLNVILARRPNLEAKNNLGNTALIEAARRSDVDATNLLLLRGCNKDVKNNEGNTALNFAINEQHVELIKLLT